MKNQNTDLVFGGMKVHESAEVIDGIDGGDKSSMSNDRELVRLDLAVRVVAHLKLECDRLNFATVVEYLSAFLIEQ